MSFLKEDFRTRVNSSNYDVCLCVAKCKIPCGRKNKPVEPIYTASDFTNHCTSFEIDQFDGEVTEEK